MITLTRTMLTCGFALLISLIPPGAGIPRAAFDAGEAAQAPAAIIIHDVTIIDVERGQAVPNQTVRIVGERIARIDDAATAEIAVGAKVISGAGLFLMPGLFDAHVHLTPSPETFGPMLLAHGVTAARDTGASTELILQLRSDALKPGAKLPQIICTGAIIDGDPPVWPFSEPCDEPEEAREAVRKLKRAGVDQIKVYSRLQPEVYRAALAEAKALGLKVTGHVPNAVSLREALEAGHDCAEHLMGFERMLLELSNAPADDRQTIWPGFAGWLQYEAIDKAKLRERLAEVARSGLTACPTLVVLQGIGRAAEPDRANADERMAYVPDVLRGFWGGGSYGEFGRFAAEIVPHVQSMIGELHRAGVPLMIGTDLANPYVFAGSSVHDEMKLFQEAGVSAADVLRSATMIPARFCGVEADLGAIAPGKLASLVLLRGNPLEDVAHASQIQRVFVRGEHYDRAALDAMLQGVRESVANAQPALAAAGPAIDMNPPGELVARGRYIMKFNGQFDAGVEEFVITRDKGGFYIRAHSQPKGGYAPPSLVNFHVDPNFNFVAADMKTLTQRPTSAKYELNGGMLIATPIEGADEAKPQEFRMPANGLVSASVNACDFAIFGAARDLEVDHQREFQAVGFGFGGWQVAAVPYAITRLADQEVTLPDGTKAMARRFATTMTAQGMKMEGEAWVDQRGVLLRSVLRAPFGQIETTLSN